MSEAATSVATRSTERWMVEMVHDRIAAGETTVASMAAVLWCGKQMEKLPHYNFSWTVCLQKICEMLRLEISSRSHCLKISVWKRLWTCRETDKYLNLNQNLYDDSIRINGSFLWPLSTVKLWVPWFPMWWLLNFWWKSNSRPIV
jgi:hypothetical protein